MVEWVFRRHGDASSFADAAIDVPQASELLVDRRMPGGGRKKKCLEIVHVMVETIRAIMTTVHSLW